MTLHVPTTLSDDKNQEFRRLYLKHYGKALTAEQANEEAFRLLCFFAIVIENTQKYYEK